jgi:beta-glucosidase
MLTDSERLALEAAPAQAALECITLLKNEHDVLPIASSANVFVSGPTANSLNALNGGWSGTWQGKNPRYNNPGRKTAVEALRDEFGRSRVQFEELESMDFSDQDIRRVASAVRRSRPDVALLFLGEMPYTEFMGNIGDLRLADNQLDLVRAVRETGTPVVAVFVEGRPRTFSQVESDLDGVVMAYLAGDFAGPAIAKVLSGSHNPSGKLPFSWPREASSHTTYDRKHTEKHHSARPQYAFGSGLSYSPVETTALRLLNEGNVVLGDTLKIEVDLVNKGDRPTNEVVMAFVQDRVASITPSVDKLKAYKRVLVDAGATMTVSLLVPTAELGFIGTDLEYVVEQGAFGLRVQQQTLEFELN